ncbi:hypothetical protein niasHT_019590 [Heterodera trifolii]|uniref:NTF2 domain-containing protein n=1 Tax=Heterodera trifolii TaxID=157864 RepID=A0ABD2L7Z5_9BILA
MVEKENDIAAAVPNNAENNGHVEAVDPSASKSAKEVPNNTEKHSAEDLMGLARLFLKEYYTKLSDRPSEAGIFYGDDSHFVHADVEETGRENIQRAIGNMGFEDCKARFYSLKTVSLPMQGDNAKLIQVCGELTLVKAAVQKQQPVLPRRFVQTIILAHQTPTVLYVKSDVFQWLDTAFLVTVSEKYNAANNAGATVPSPPTTVAEQQQPLENGGGQVAPPPMVNGGSGKLHQIVVESEPKKASVVVDHSPQKEPEKKTAAPSDAAPTVVDSLPSPTSTPNKKDEVAAISTVAPPSSVVDVPKPVDIAPPPSLSQPVAATVAAAPPPTTEQQPKPVVVTTAVANNTNNSLAQKPKSVVAGSYAAIAAAARGNVPNNVDNIVTVHVPAAVAATNGPTAPTPSKEMPQHNNNIAKHNPEHQIAVKQQQHPPPSLPPVLNIAPRREWTHRIYFSQLTKPGRFVDFKLGQQELMREIQAITDGVEFVGIKPNSLRREYRTAFGFIDFTTAADMQAVYDACKRDPNTGAFVFNVQIPAFDFNGGLLLSADKTNNLGGGVYK